MAKNLKKIPTLKNADIITPKHSKVIEMVTNVLVFAAFVLLVFAATAGISWLIINTLENTTRTHAASDTHNNTTVIANIDGETKQFNDDIDIKYSGTETTFTQGKRTYKVQNEDVIIIEPTSEYADVISDVSPKTAIIHVGKNDVIIDEIYRIVDEPACSISPGMLLFSLDKVYKLSPEKVEFKSETTEDAA